jgi:hypothetical protein
MDHPKIESYIHMGQILLDYILSTHDLDSNNRIFFYLSPIIKSKLNF